MDIEFIRSAIDAAMTAISNDPYGATSLKDRNLAINELQDALDETCKDGDKYKSRMCGRHKHRIALFCEECFEDFKVEIKFDKRPMLLDENGNRSIFDDVDA